MNLTFPLNSARLDDEAAVRSRLAALADFLNAHLQTQLILTGHADSSGAEAINQSLSEQRAVAMAKVLEERGVAVGQLIRGGGGSSLPFVPEQEGDQGRNRRVELAPF